jgi:tetratricopeptide (TPR) repeat protein
MCNAIADHYVERFRNFQKAQHFYDHALSLAGQCNSTMAEVRALRGLIAVEYSRGNFSESLRLAHKAARIMGNVSGQCHRARWQILCYKALGDFKHVTQVLGEAKELVASAGIQGGQFHNIIMDSEAEMHLLRTEYTEARHIQEAILDQTSAVLSPVGHGYALINIALLDILTGNSADMVVRNLDAATSAFCKAQYLHGISWCELGHADLQLREGRDGGQSRVYAAFFSRARQ